MRSNEKATVLQVLLAFLKLGCTAFGGPVAHLGYFRDEFVKRRGWISEEEYADLVALCQFLPGPASSQVGFAIGHRMAGLPGAFAAWVGFTLPAAALMLAFALGLDALGAAASAGWVAGLKLAAVAVVADAIWGMASRLCPDRVRALLAAGCAALLLVTADPVWQVGAIALGAAAGGLLLRKQVGVRSPSPEPAAPWHRGLPWLVAFVLPMLVLPSVIHSGVPGWVMVFDGFYRAGALVFGGGHVVLPLLDSFTVGQYWVTRETFLAGYGAAQAIPGPLFAFTAFLGASIAEGPGGVAGGLLALGATYLPSWLIVLGALPYWKRLRALAGAQAALAGANAAVVGLLLAAFIGPIWTAAVTDAGRAAFALCAFALLRHAGLPPWALVLLCAVAGGILF